MRPHGTQTELERRRRWAVSLLGKGLNLSAVAKKVGSSVSSVHWWKMRHQKKGDQALKSKPVPGRPAKLTVRQKRSLVGLLLKGSLKSGYSTDLWTTRRIAQVIGRRFGTEYHPNHIWRLLQEMGWSCQKPETQAREMDKKAVERWKRYNWPHIKKVQKTWGPSRVSR